MRAFVALVLLTLAACGSEPAPAPGGATPEEAQALNDAATMLDDQSLLPPANQANAETTR